MSVVPIVQRQYAQAIAKEPQGPLVLRQHATRELADEALHYLGAVLLISGEDDFRVALRAEIVGKRPPQFSKVEDLAVEAKVRSLEERRHRLRGAADINDRQPAMPEPNSLA